MSNLTASVTSERNTALQQLIKQTATRKSITRKEAQSLAGQLHFVAQMCLQADLSSPDCCAQQHRSKLLGIT